MKKHKIIPTILKPLIDEEAALQFASYGVDELSKTASKPAGSDNELKKGLRRISLTIAEDLYNKIAKEAAKKNRSVEEHLRKHLVKRYQ